MSLAVKICGMLESDNIIAAAQLKPDFMGFIFYPESPRFAGRLLDPEILSNLSPDIRKTGVFVNSEINQITDTVEKYSLNAVQLHGDEQPELCYRIKDTGIQVIKVFNIKERMSIKMYEDFIACTDYFLFDTVTVHHGGSGQKFNWKVLDKYETGNPFILSGGISPGDSGNLWRINNSSFYGIDLNSRFEIKPGLKDIEKLKIFIDELRYKHQIL